MRSGLNTANLSGFSTTGGTGSALTMATSGNGMIHMRAADGAFVRCVFTFNTMGNTGLGQCLRNDGREFDLLIRR